MRLEAWGGTSQEPPHSACSHKRVICPGDDCSLAGNQLLRGKPGILRMRRSRTISSLSASFIRRNPSKPSLGTNHDISCTAQNRTERHTNRMFVDNHQNANMKRAWYPVDSYSLPEPIPSNPVHSGVPESRG